MFFFIVVVLPLIWWIKIYICRIRFEYKYETLDSQHRLDSMHQAMLIVLVTVVIWHNTVRNKHGRRFRRGRGDTSPIIGVPTCHSTRLTDIQSDPSILHGTQSETSPLVGTGRSSSLAFSFASPITVIYVPFATIHGCVLLNTSDGLTQREGIRVRCESG